jgi:hypothetical protein
MTDLTKSFRIFSVTYQIYGIAPSVVPIMFKSDVSVNQTFTAQEHAVPYPTILTEENPLLSRSGRNAWPIAASCEAGISVVG